MMSDAKIRAAREIVLDNLARFWPYTTNLHQDFYEDALRWAEDKGYVLEGKLTNAGKGALDARLFD